MTQNRRILLNIVATYGRSLYALVIGLFCGRWALMALGQVDTDCPASLSGCLGDDWIAANRFERICHE